jgi:multiple sugar transport system permease protein
MHRTGRIILYFFLLVFAALVIIPFLWMVLNSFKFQTEINLAKTFLPKVWTLRNYFYVFSTAPIVRWFFNSVFVSVTATTIILFTSTLIGYVFAKYEFRFKKALFMLFWQL